jgi:ABC-type lipoprotein release transport system permease subunit
MKFILQLAVKNLSRYKRRTIITAVAIAVGLMMYIIVDSILRGASLESMRNLRWYETASLRVYAEGYWEDRAFLPLENSIEDPASIMSLVEGEQGVATVRTTFAAEMILYSDDFGENGNMNVKVTAIDPTQDFEVYRFEDTLVEGRFL